jgi:uncharacterized protein YggU (UPF0235/DUF167 family)
MSVQLPIDTSDRGVSFVVRLTPKGGRNKIDGWSTAADGSQHLKTRVSALPENGKANAALIALLSKALSVPASAIAIVRGETGRIKHMTVLGDASRLRTQLEALGEAK